MPEGDLAALTRVLRVAFTAVNQQFTHVLLLSARGDRGLAGRITEVDDADFRTAMRIIDHMVARGSVPPLTSDWFVPGLDTEEILLAEQAVEGRFAEAIGSAHCTSPAAKDLVGEAAAPRAAYASWLAERMGAPESTARQPGRTSVDILFSRLMTWIEQTTVHAFVQWHAGNRAMADAAWMTSGGAMIRGSVLTRALAALGTAPAPGEIAAPKLARDGAECLVLDRGLAEQCVERARMAGESAGDTTLARECRKTADLAAAIAAWRPGAPHPARASNPEGLTSFAATLERYVRRTSA